MATTAGEAREERPECFVIMPISDPAEYNPGHFKRVFEDLLVPACELAGYKPVRADQVRQTNLIHLDVLQRLLDSPMVLCDLSSRNPNVLFELGLRQAFDRPVALVREVGTPDIFDIAPLRFSEYRSGLVYREVVEDQEILSDCITQTERAFRDGRGVNSIVRILSLTEPARLPQAREGERDPVLSLVQAEISELRHEVRRLFREPGQARAAPQSDWDFIASTARNLRLQLEKRVFVNQDDVAEVLEEAFEQSALLRRRLEQLRDAPPRHHSAVARRLSTLAEYEIERLAKTIVQLRGLAPEGSET